jgi:potassium channel subfamily K
LIGDIAAMHIHASPNFPEQVYSGGFWYALGAATIYLILMIGQLSTLLGYIRGHFPQHFELSDDQQTLIVQTMLYFIWLAGGAGLYSNLEGWHFVDAVSTLFFAFIISLISCKLYWAAVTLLTVGYGDLAPLTSTGRGLLVPYSFTGILILGLVISSIFKSVTEMGEKNIERNHYERQRTRTVGRTATSSLELERREIEIELAHERAMAKAAARPSARSPATFQTRNNLEFLLHRKTTFDEMTQAQKLQRRDSSVSVSDTLKAGSIKSSNTSLLGRTTTRQSTSKKERILLLREEKV